MCYEVNISNQCNVEGNSYHVDCQYYHIQCRPLISALNAWADQAYYTTARLIANQFAGNGCMHDLTTESSFYSQAAWVIDVRGLFL